MTRKKTKIKMRRKKRKSLMQMEILFQNQKFSMKMK